MENGTKKQAMSVSQDSSDALEMLLSQYVAGSLPVPVLAMVKAHLEMRKESLAIVSGMEGAAGSEIERLGPLPLANRDSVFDAIVSSPPPERASGATKRRNCRIFPESLCDFVGFTADEVPWRTKLPGFREYTIGQWDGFDAKLLWIRPGRAVPAHTHEGSELTLVLNGGFSDDNCHYDRGDIAAADESVDHRPVADAGEPCICMAITTAPLKLTGSFSQLFSDIFGR